MKDKPQDKSQGPLFKEETIPVGDLEVDREIQRYVINLKKVENIVRNFNQAALGVITVSKRNAVTYVILDGWHRVQAVKELTDNQGSILCHVYEGLSRAEEAQLFLDLNAGNQPNLLEKFRAKMVAGDEGATEVTKLVHAYGWTINPITGNGNIQCVGTLERIYKRSTEHDADPNWLQLALLVVTRAWGMERAGGQSAILEGLAVLFAEHGVGPDGLLDVDRLINKLTTYPGGPRGLGSDASNMAAIRRGRLPIAVAELVTDEYNKGKQAKRLPPLKKRRL